MSDLFKSSFGGSSSQSPPPDLNAQKEALIQQVRNEFAISNAQELINKMNEKCFTKCIPKPSTSLSSSEETCLTKCLDRYMEAFNIVSRSYTSRVSRERLQESI